MNFYFFFEFFNNFENVIIRVEATKVLQYKLRNLIEALLRFSCLVRGSQQALGHPSPGARIQEEPQWGSLPISNLGILKKCKVPYTFVRFPEMENGNFCQGLGGALSRLCTIVGMCTSGFQETFSKNVNTFIQRIGAQQPN